MEKTTIIMHSGDLDKIYSTMIIANGSLSMGMEVSIFFTFWGLERLKKNNLEGGKLSRMNMFGLGKFMVNKSMEKANVAKLERLMKDYKELGGKIIACEMTMDIMKIKKEDLRENLIDEYGAVGTYIKEARESKINLFI
ncbi:DsrE/DsrF/DrsH-like family protein [uncultured Ilyobacter sp.]|uniref:DsrE/DsrF/DrsH-like family protein n=1 Tax=uncultured Ilyobacter sp. TaxID=544433 RepID=UPI0029C74992|nr:DsrE/DsrF/DrsH-like family protein [uncultured Ilyobacter sp.]